MNSITFPVPFDAHLHLRDGNALMTTVMFTARQFACAIVMPNLAPPVTTVALAAAYRERIIDTPPYGFEPLMTLYLTGATTPGTIREAKASGFIHGVKYYPAGATTNSEAGLANIQDAATVLEVMEEVGMPLLLHGEVADPSVDVFDREAQFVDDENGLPWVVKKFPKLRMVLEHISTRRAAQFVMSASANVVATITPQHILCDRNDMLGNGIRPHHYCKPILKRREDREHLLSMATLGNPKFFLGTDSAPHPQHGAPGKAKETSCGCAGCFTAPHALELYAEAFDSVGKLDQLENFATHFGREFYGLPYVDGSVTLTREEWTLPVSYAYSGGHLVPFRQEVPLKWRAVRNG